MLAGEDLTAARIDAEVSALRESLATGLADATVEVTYELRYAGQAFELPIPGPERPEPEELAAGFASEHERRYGYRDPDAPVELVNIRVALAVPGPSPESRAAASGALERRVRRARFAGAWSEAAVLRGEPEAGLRVDGPCIFELPEATLVLPPGWAARVDDHGTIAAERPR